MMDKATPPPNVDDLNRQLDELRATFDNVYNTRPIEDPEIERVGAECTEALRLLHFQTYRVIDDTTSLKTLGRSTVHRKQMELSDSVSYRVMVHRLQVRKLRQAEEQQTRIATLTDLRAHAATLDEAIDKLRAEYRAAEPGSGAQLEIQLAGQRKAVERAELELDIENVASGNSIEFAKQIRLEDAVADARKAVKSTEKLLRTNPSRRAA